MTDDALASVRIGKVELTVTSNEAPEPVAERVLAKLKELRGYRRGGWRA